MKFFPLISVLMPAWNAETYLESAIKSILNQTYENFEFIIVDDGSSDLTVSICETYLERDSRIHFFKQGHKGIASSLNLALVQSRGKFIARMDADDISEPERFEQQLLYLELKPQLDFIGTQAFLIDENNKIIGQESKNESSLINSRLMPYHSPIIHPTLFATKTAMKELGGYRNIIAEDLDLFQRAHLSGYLIGNLTKPLLRYRCHKRGDSSKRSLSNLICTNALLFKSRKISLNIYLEETSRLIGNPCRGSACLSLLLELRCDLLEKARNAKTLQKTIFYFSAIILSFFHIQLLFSLYRAVSAIIISRITLFSTVHANQDLWIKY